MYKRKRSLATAKDVNSPFLTSETTSSTASSKESILQNESIVNRENASDDIRFSKGEKTTKQTFEEEVKETEKDILEKLEDRLGKKISPKTKKSVKEYATNRAIEKLGNGERTEDSLIKLMEQIDNEAVYEDKVEDDGFLEHLKGVEKVYAMFYYKFSDGTWNDGDFGGQIVNGGNAFICEWDNMNEITSFNSTVSEWAKEEIEEAYKSKIIPEELIGEDLTKKADRAEFAAIAVKMYENLSGKQTFSAVNPFNDINDNKYKEDILKAYSLNITLGTGEDKFTPDDNITREQMAAMLTRAYKKSEFDGWTIENDAQYPLNYMGVPTFSDDNEISDYAKEAVYFMVRWNVIQGVGNNTFAPKAGIDLGEGYRFYTIFCR